MWPTARTLKVLTVAVGGPLTVVWLGFVLAAAGVPFAIPLVLILILLGGWGVYAYLRGRQSRRDELLQLASAAVAARVPLAPAVREYVAERPRHWWAWGVALLGCVLVFPLVPLAPLLWAVFWLDRFDRRAGEFADLLDDGASLADAYREVPTVATTEARLAAAVGEDTGDLAAALRRADRESLAAAWVELLPRLLYPLFVLFMVTNTGSFSILVLLPKFKRIFDEFGRPLPELTQWMFAAGDLLEPVWALIPLGVVGVAAVVGAAFASRSVRWRLPLLGRLYRWEIQGQVLRQLGTLVAAGRPAPAALRLLADVDEFPRPARGRLEGAARAVGRGEPLADALRGAGLIPGRMAPLVRAAEPARTLPWVLAEVGDIQGGRAFRLVRRLSQVLSPLLVVAVGAVVGFVVIAMFVPLISLLAGLST